MKNEKKLSEKKIAQIIVEKDKLKKNLDNSNENAAKLISEGEKSKNMLDSQVNKYKELKKNYSKKISEYKNKIEQLEKDKIKFGNWEK